MHLNIMDGLKIQGSLLAVILIFFPALHITAGSDTVNGNSKPSQKLIRQAVAAKSFVQSRGFNSNTCFLADLSENSGRRRFYVFDLKNYQILFAGLVTHGGCNSVVQRPVQFSNDPGCGCSSFGKYKVAGKYSGRYGNAYKLVGLDSSNSNAYKRAIVLHGHSCVPDTECYPNNICTSEGCTTVSPAFLKKLSTVIDTARKPILLWVFQ